MIQTETVRSLQTAIWTLSLGSHSCIATHSLLNVLDWRREGMSLKPWKSSSATNQCWMWMLNGCWFYSVDRKMVHYEIPLHSNEPPMKNYLFLNFRNITVTFSCFHYFQSNVLKVEKFCIIKASLSFCIIHYDHLGATSWLSGVR